MRNILLGLSKINGIGWKSIHKLIIAGIDEQALNLTARQWKNDFPFLSEKQANSLSQWMNKEHLVEYIQELKRNGIDFVTVVDDTYPPLLKEISFAPWLLFLRGEQKLLHSPSLAVVGSRKTTSYGRMVTERLVPQLINKGWFITSGLALGIDSIAHQVTLQRGGKGIAVLGCGIDQIYPEQNKNIYHMLIKQGLLVSEYPPGTKAHPSFFPQRNRIIAGLSYGVIVVEAAKKSGSLITAQYALEQGREVFAVPGSIFNAQSVGTNLLIQKHGAKLITNDLDVLDELSHISLPNSENIAMKEEHAEIELNNDERKILEVLRSGKKHINELQSATSFSFSQLSKLLLRLELTGEIKALPGSFYICISYNSD